MPRRDGERSTEAVTRRLLLGSAFAVMVASPAGGHSTRLGNILIGHAWVLPSVSGARETQGFVPLLVQAGDDRLTDLSSPLAARIEIRRTDETGRTTRLVDLPLVAGRPVAMRPGGLHLVFLGIGMPFVTGARVPVTLRFARAGAVDFEFWVEAAPYAG